MVEMFNLDFNPLYVMMTGSAVALAFLLGIGLTVTAVATFWSTHGNSGWLALIGAYLSFDLAVDLTSVTSSLGARTGSGQFLLAVLAVIAACHYASQHRSVSVKLLQVTGSLGAAALLTTIGTEFSAASTAVSEQSTNWRQLQGFLWWLDLALLVAVLLAGIYRLYAVVVRSRGATTQANRRQQNRPQNSQSRPPAAPAAPTAPTAPVAPAAPVPVTPTTTTATDGTKLNLSKDTKPLK
jgi:hypothetical protein